MVSTKEKFDHILSGYFHKQDWIFFFHWSEIVESNVYKNNRCVVMHTSNLPNGRGGSPIQNQIISGVIETKVNALEMCESVDAGAIYDSRPITLQGTAFDIWLSIAAVSEKIMIDMVDNKKNTIPIKQKNGTTEKYRRRNSSFINFNEVNSTSKIYDIIRMLDCDGYPKSKINIGGYVIEFFRASYDGSDVLCDAKITKKK